MLICEIDPDGRLLAALKRRRQKLALRKAELNKRNARHEMATLTEIGAIDNQLDSVKRQEQALKQRNARLKVEKANKKLIKTMRPPKPKPH